MKTTRGITLLVGHAVYIRGPMSGWAEYALVELLLPPNSVQLVDKSGRRHIVLSVTEVEVIS
jgi:hypothetical protein